MIQRDTFSIVVPVSFFNEVVSKSVFTVLGDELVGSGEIGSGKLIDEELGIVNQVSTGAREVVNVSSGGEAGGPNGC